MLTFEKENHIYRINGNVVPSVTQTIGGWIKVGRVYVNTFTGAAVPADLFEAAGAFGTDVHTMISYHITGDLDTDALGSDFLAVLVQFERWVDTVKPEIIDNEVMLYSPRCQFAGTRDLKCIINKKLHIVDFKTGAYDMAGPQLAAYVQLDKENDKSRAIRHRSVLYLPKDGSDYKFVSFRDASDFPFFLSRLATYNYLKGR